MYQNKPAHYWLHNREAFFRVWEDMPSAFRTVVAEDIEHNSSLFKSFCSMVEKETNYNFNNSHHPQNNKYSFKYSYYEN